MVLLRKQHILLLSLLFILVSISFAAEDPTVGYDVADQDSLVMVQLDTSKKVKNFLPGTSILDPSKLRESVPQTLEQILISSNGPSERKGLRKARNTAVYDTFIVRDFKVTRKQYDENVVVAMIEKGDSAYRIFHTLGDDVLQIDSTYDFRLETIHKYTLNTPSHSVYTCPFYYGKGEKVKSTSLLCLNGLDSVSSIQRMKAFRSKRNSNWISAF